MKIAVVYNRESKSVINLFGMPNREKYGKRAIKRIADSLRAGGHQVITLEGDKDLIPRLENFMPRVMKGERPGMVFNLSYGIQGQARYTHVPGILEMVGVPYVGSGPLAHSLALDKVVAKMIFLQHRLPTPDFAVLSSIDFDEPDIAYPLIVKPKNESVSMGIRIVNNLAELREAAVAIFDNFANQAVLVEQYIEGREINVGLLGNNSPDAFAPCEILFGDDGPRIYTHEDKDRVSGRQIDWQCPAAIGPELTAQAQELARSAFTALGCYDCARVDMRLDNNGRLYILEINSLPSLGEHGSYVIAAQREGLDFTALVNRLVEVASARYFGTPDPPLLHPGERDPAQLLFSFLTSRRDQMEKRLEEWVAVSSRTADPVGSRLAMDRLGTRMQEMKMVPAAEQTDDRTVWTWQTRQGYAGGTLFIGHMDVSHDHIYTSQGFRRDPEWFYGEGIATSRAPLVMLEFILRALRHHRVLHRLPIGVLYYIDEGRECRYSAELIRRAAAQAGRVFVLRPGSGIGNVCLQRRGQRKYRIVLESRSVRIGRQSRVPSALLLLSRKVEQLVRLSRPDERLDVALVDVQTESFHMSRPHRVTATVIVSYREQKLADGVLPQLQELFAMRGVRMTIDLLSDRPPMPSRRRNSGLYKSLQEIAERWEIPLDQESSQLPSVAGLVPASVPVVCGVGPVARDLYTPQEAVNRMSLLQRALLMAEFLARDLAGEQEQGS